MGFDSNKKGTVGVIHATVTRIGLLLGSPQLINLHIHRWRFSTYGSHFLLSGGGSILWSGGPVVPFQIGTAGLNAPLICICWVRSCVRSIQDGFSRTRSECRTLAREIAAAPRNHPRGHFFYSYGVVHPQKNGEICPCWRAQVRIPDV